MDGGDGHTYFSFISGPVAIAVDAAIIGFTAAEMLTFASMFIFQVLKVTGTKFHIEIVGTVGNDPLIAQLGLILGRKLLVPRSDLLQLDGEAEDAFQPILDHWRENLVDLNILPPGAPLAAAAGGGHFIHTISSLSN